MTKLTDFWYDSMNDAYENDLTIYIKLWYIEAITDTDYETHSN